MSEWSLPVLLAGLHDKVEQSLDQARRSFAHPGTKGDASEAVWVELLNTYLPKRYEVATAHVVDNHGSFSEQIDVVVYDRQYTPLIFEMHGIKIIPAESVYAVFVPIPMKPPLCSEMIASPVSGMISPPV